MKRLLLAIAAAFAFTAIASANHLVYLPYVPDTPLMQQVIHAQEFTWCVDQRASAYPNFVAQVDDVLDQYDALVGIHNRQVSFGSGCQVQMLMPDTVDCGGCAAYINYANWPVSIVYKWTLGYTDWRSAIGHELGHGLLGLHEQYIDSGGQIGCTYRADTVMSCGPPYVRYPQPRDISYGCAIIQTAWCGNPPPPVECQPWLGFDPCTNTFIREDGWRQHLDDGSWYDWLGRRQYDGCNGDGYRWSPTQGRWKVPGDRDGFDADLSQWITVPAC